MPLTVLDANAALVLIDLQNGIVAMPTVHPAGEIVRRAVELADAFRRRGLPVVLVNVNAAAPGRIDNGPRSNTLPEGWSDFVPELQPGAADYVVTKQRPGAFIGTSLRDILEDRGVTQVFLAGIATSGGVEATARSAADYGYNVVLITDAMTDRDAEAHRFCIEKIFPRIGETESTTNVLQKLST